MEFGYFSLSDNHYENNSRTSNQFISPGTEAYPFAECAAHKKARIRNAFRVVLAVSQTKAAIHPADLLFER